MTLRIDNNPTPVIHDPRGREVEYSVTYETEIAGHESPLMLDLGKLPNWTARYRIRVHVEQLPAVPVVGVPEREQT